LPSTDAPIIVKATLDVGAAIVRTPASLDEAEIERLLQRLKTVGHLDQKTSSEEK